MLKSAGSNTEVIDELNRWKAEKPLSPAPYYYHACVLLGQGKYDDFLKMADH